MYYAFTDMKIINSAFFTHWSRPDTALMLRASAAIYFYSFLFLMYVQAKSFIKIDSGEVYILSGTGPYGMHNVYIACTLSNWAALLSKITCNVLMFTRIHTQVTHMKLWITVIPQPFVLMYNMNGNKVKSKLVLTIFSNWFGDDGNRQEDTGRKSAAGVVQIKKVMENNNLNNW